MTVIVDVQRIYDGELPCEKQFQQWASAALQVLNEDCELTIRLVGREESASLNSNYRGKENPTNVLSFPFESLVPIEPRLLGDLVICVPLIEKEAGEQDKLVECYWAHMVVHGCLHLLGYDHVEESETEVMESLEINILHFLNMGDPYQSREQDERLNND